MTTARARWRRLRRLLAYGLASLVILAGLAVAVASRLLPLVQSHPEHIAAWLSQRSGQQVRFDSAQAHWTRRGPLFELRALRVGPEAAALTMDRAELLVDIYGGMLPSRALTVLTLRGVDLRIARNAEGVVEVAGLARRGGGSAGLMRLAGLGELRLEAATLRVEDALSGRRIDFDLVDARLQAVEAGLRLGIRARQGDSAPLRIAGTVAGDLSGGELWIGGRELRLADWLAGHEAGGVEIAGGTADVDLWLRIGQRRLTRAQVEIQAQDLRLRANTPLVMDPGAEIEPRVGIDALSLSALWQSSAEGWRLDVPALEMEDGSGWHRTGSVRVTRTGERLQLRAERAELDVLAPVAALSDALPPRLRAALFGAMPRLALSDLRIDCTDGHGCGGQLQLEALGWSPTGKVPGVSGFSGRLDFDPGAASLQLHEALLAVHSPQMFRDEIVAVASGRIDAWKSAQGWWLWASPLMLRGADFAGTVRGGAELQGDGTRPALALAVEVAAGDFSAAPQFWVRNRMPPKVIAWLDRALVAGQVERAAMVFAGDLDHWPFRNAEGRVDAHFEVAGTVLDYKPGEWPRGEQITGWAHFENESMDFQLHGSVLGNRIERAHGTIADLRSPVLELDIDGTGTGPALLDLLRASPLQRKYPEHWLGVSVGGRADISMDLRLPLKKELGTPRVRGRADLVGADLVDTKYDLRFDDATGRVRFSEQGFGADELRVGYQGQPATFSLAVGAYTSREELVAEGSLRGRLSADSLLDRHPSVTWLEPYLDGSSEWSLALGVAADDAGTGAASQRLRLRSDLVGTTVALPAPLRKAPEARMPLDLRIALPVEHGGIDLRLGELLRLRGTLDPSEGFTGVAAFGDADEVEVPERGIAVVGTVPVLDAAGWAAFAVAGEGKGAGIGSIDVHAGELDVLDRAFVETRVQYRRDADAATLLLRGPEVEGEVRIPTRDLDTAGITARMAHLHWPTAKAASQAVPANPAGIPPLHLWFGQLRFGEADLGEARLETYPTAQGMHVQLFESRSPRLDLRGSGDWTRVGLRERSQFELAFTAPDLGEMLQALGFTDMVEKGPTMATLQAQWRGAPSAFALERVEGTLGMKVGSGRIPEVRPGAGRILGLLSLTEIPRRLSLDFSDFLVEGFAFNSIEGSFALRQGSAFTDDLKIDSPAAEIEIRGRTGLKAKDYDQIMEVRPRAGGVLTVVGALAGGPAGAAIGAVAQAILQQPLGEMTRAVYHVGGSWDAPQIERLTRPQDVATPAAGQATEEPAREAAGDPARLEAAAGG
ncbi:MAG TPA: YhdP family protein [Xanthomonadaceae bacterium]|nr:YhdP family protein [Xanthomonadaceae bacterium]